MDVSTYEKMVRDKFTALFNENKKIESIYKKVKNGSAGYEEANAFAVEIGNILADVFGNTVDGENLDDMALYVVENMLGQNVQLSSMVCESVQLNLNDAAEINIAPVEPPKARTKSKIDGITTNFKETGSVEKLMQSAKTLTLSTVDEWVKTNADFQAKAGLSPVIVRKWDGTWGSHDTRHTDYCSKLQGTYNYYPSSAGSSMYFGGGGRMHGWDGPADLFKRHEGCQCVISYYPNKKAQGRITALAKGEKDTDKQLWNTGQVFSTSRSAELRRRRQQYEKEEARKILNEEWKGGLNGNAERHFK